MKLERHMYKLINQYKIMRLCNKVQHKGQTIKGCCIMTDRNMTRTITGQHRHTKEYITWSKVSTTEKKSREEGYVAMKAAYFRLEL